MARMPEPSESERARSVNVFSESPSSPAMIMASMMSVLWNRLSNSEVMRALYTWSVR